MVTWKDKVSGKEVELPDESTPAMLTRPRYERVVVVEIPTEVIVEEVKEEEDVNSTPTSEQSVTKAKRGRGKQL
jgi:ubiquitin